MSGLLSATRRLTPEYPHITSNVRKEEAIGWSPYTTDGNTNLLIQSDDTDDTYVFTDDADPSDRHAITRYGSVVHDTAQAKFSSSSIWFPGGSGDYLSVPNHVDWQFGTAPFTIDFWVRWDSYGDIVDNKVFMQYYNTGAGTFEDEWTISFATDAVQFHMAEDATVNVYYGWKLPLPWLDSQWYHVALVRTTPNLYAFVNGEALVPTITNRLTASTNFPSFHDVLTIGRGVYGGRAFQGWLDGIRISKGVARWTSNFPVYTSPVLVSS